MVKSNWLNGNFLDVSIYLFYDSSVAFGEKQLWLKENNL